MSDKTYIGNNLNDLDFGEPLLPVSKVILNVDSETSYIAGDDTGSTIEQDCAWATQEMADSILAVMRGFVYKPFTGKNALLDPSAEIGDGINVGGVYSVLSGFGRNLDRQAAATVEAPGTDEIEDEYPYKSKQRKKTDRAIASYARISKTVNGLALTVTNGSTTSEIELKSGEAVIASGTIKMNGLVEFSGLEDGTTIINGHCVSTGKIQDKTGANYWDLDRGKLVLTNTEINGTGGSASFTNCPIYTIASKTWKAADYSVDEATTMQQIIREGNPTSEQLERYDFNLDGRLSVADIVLLGSLVTSGLDGITAWKCQLDPENEQAIFRVWLERTWGTTNGSGYTTTQNEVFLVSAGGTTANSLVCSGEIETQSLHSDDDMTVGDGKNTVLHQGNTGLINLSISDLTSSNPTATLTYPHGTVGFHVYGYPVSGASMVGMFIPLDICDGTSFQLADNGNYVTFTMTSDTLAQTITIKRTGGAGFITSVHPLYFGTTT